MHLSVCPLDAEPHTLQSCNAVMILLGTPGTEGMHGCCSSYMELTAAAPCRPVEMALAAG